MTSGHQTAGFQPQSELHTHELQPAVTTEEQYPAAGKMKTKAYLGSHFPRTLAAATKAGAEKDRHCLISFGLWALSRASGSLCILLRPAFFAGEWFGGDPGNLVLLRPHDVPALLSAPRVYGYAPLRPLTFVRLLLLWLSEALEVAFGFSTCATTPPSFAMGRNLYTFSSFGGRLGTGTLAHRRTVTGLS